MQQNNLRKRIMNFRYFSRKNYALFNCLKREVRIGVLSVATLTNATVVLHAQEQEIQVPTKYEQLGEATVLASRVPLANEIIARQVTVITREDLNAAGVVTLNDALKLSASIDVRQRGGFGIQTDVSINGGTFDQIALYINGVPYNNPQTGHNAIDFPFTLQDVAHIEVLEGASTKLFGTQAFSGAINIVTHARGKSMIQLQGGSYGTIITDARGVLISRKDIETSLSGRFYRSDGVVTNGNFKGGSLFWQGGYNNKETKLTWQAGASLKDFGANSFYSATYNNQWEATRRYYGAIQAETGSSIHFTPKLSWVRSTDHYLLIRDKPSIYENFNRTDVITLNLGAWKQWAWGRTAVGTEIQNEHLLSRNLGFDLDKTQWVRIPKQDSLFYTRGANRTNINFYAEHNILLEKWTFSLGVFAQKNTLTDTHFHFFSGIDLSYRLNRKWRFFASWNQAMRQPTFTDLWYRSPTHEGNKELAPERNSAFRIGADFRSKGFTASAKTFYQHGTNMIDWVQFQPGGKWMSNNFAINNYGLNICLNFKLKDLFENQYFLERLTIDYAYINQKRKDDTHIFKANYALEYLRHKFAATLTHQLFSYFHLAWNFRLQHREGSYEIYINNKGTGILAPYGTHAQLDCRMSWERPKYIFSIELMNLTGHRFFDYGNVQQAGFLLMAGARYNF